MAVQASTRRRVITIVRTKENDARRRGVASAVESLREFAELDARFEARLALLAAAETIEWVQLGVR